MDCLARSRLWPSQLVPQHGAIASAHRQAYHGDLSGRQCRRLPVPLKARFTAHEGRPPALSSQLGEEQEPDDPAGWDDDKEASRIWRRTMYTHEDWRRHRSTYRFVRHLSTFWQSRIVRSVLRPVACVTAISIVICGYQTLCAQASLPFTLPSLPVLGLEPFQLTSFALSLLLVFRTNSSYSRWHEARSSFGRINTGSRDICRQVLSWLPASSPARQMICRWLVALCYSSKHMIRENEPLARPLKAWLEPKELEGLVQSPHPSHYCLLVLSHALNKCGLDTIRICRLQECLSAVYASLYTCDRILNTPIPLSYTRHTSRFLVFWLMLLPLALWPGYGWAAVPIASLISFVLLGIEEIGVEIEEPFSILALDKLCQDVERHITDMLRMDSGAAAVAAAAVEQQPRHPQGHMAAEQPAYSM